VSVLAVVVFHLSPIRFPSGYLGVDVFFVISGYLITPKILEIVSEKNYTNFRMRLFNFYYKRFHRLAPALFWMLTISYPVIFLLAPTNDLPVFFKQSITTWLGFGNVGAILNNPDYFNPNPNALLHTWSLGVEQQIYFALPIIVWFFVLQKKLRVTTVFLLLFIVSFAAYSILQSLDGSLEIFNVSISNLSYFSTITRVWQFLFGGLVFFCSNKINFIQLRKSHTSYLILILIVVLLFSHNTLNLFTNSILATVFTGLFLLITNSKSFNSVIFKFIIWLGDRSYSIYLVHLPTIYIARYAPILGENESRALHLVFSLILILLLSEILFKKVEIKYWRQT
jgi:peptidoglycan/LPS O-acetylase OafA/YrhL